MKKVLKDDKFFSMTWDFLHTFLATQCERGGDTIKSYTDALTIFRRYVTDEKKIPITAFQFNDVTLDFMLDYRDYLSGKGAKPSTVNHRLAVVSAYLKYAASRKVELQQVYLRIREVPWVTVPSKVHSMIEEQDSIKELLVCPGRSKKGMRDQMILVLLYDTAIRAAELLSLNLGDVVIDCDQPYILVCGKGNKERYVGLSDKTVPLLSGYIRLFHTDKSAKDTPLFYTVLHGEQHRMTERNLERIVQKYGEIAREKDPRIPKRVTPHTLRRTRATGLYRAGVPIETVALILGHSSPTTTRKSYAVPSVEQKRKAMTRGTDAEPDTSDEGEKPLWGSNEEVARLCGLR